MNNRAMYTQRTRTYRKFRPDVRVDGDLVTILDQTGKEFCTVHRTDRATLKAMLKVMLSSTEWNAAKKLQAVLRESTVD